MLVPINGDFFSGLLLDVFYRMDKKLSRY